MDLNTSALMQGVMDSKIASLLYQSMGTQKQEDRRMPDSTRRAFLSRMRVDAATSRQGAQNMKDAASMVTTAQTGTTAIKQILTDMRKVAVDMVTHAGDLTADQFASLSAQLQDYAKQMVATADTTEFNGFKLLNGSAGMNKDGVIQLQAGNSTVQEVLVNMVNSAVTDPSKVLDGGNMNLRNMAGLMTATDGASAQNVLDLISSVFDRVQSIEARYSNDIKSLGNLSVLLESQADIFDNVKNYHTAAKEKKPPSYLDALMNGGYASGNIISGNG